MTPERNCIIFYRAGPLHLLIKNVLITLPSGTVVMCENVNAQEVLLRFKMDSDEFENRPFHFLVTNRFFFQVEFQCAHEFSMSRKTTTSARVHVANLELAD